MNLYRISRFLFVPPSTVLGHPVYFT